MFNVESLKFKEMNKGQIVVNVVLAAAVAALFVLHFGNSQHYSKFFILSIFVMMTCDQ